MRLKCPKCGTSVDASGFASGERVMCLQCRTRLKLPAATTDATGPVEGDPFDFDTAPAPIPPPLAPAQPQPMLVPVPYSAEHPDLTQEKIEDLRDRRDDRRERRQFDREDRFSNGIGLTGFALCCTAALLVASGAIFASELKLYSWFATITALFLTLGGLPCGVIGCLRPGRNRIFAIVAAALGGLLLLVFLPLLMMTLVNSK